MKYLALLLSVMLFLHFYMICRCLSRKYSSSVLALSKAIILQNYNFFSSVRLLVPISSRASYILPRLSRCTSLNSSKMSNTSALKVWAMSINLTSSIANLYYLFLSNLHQTLSYSSIVLTLSFSNFTIDSFSKAFTV